MLEFTKMYLKKLEKPAVIVIEKDTRERLKSVAMKNERYTDTIDHLLESKKKEKELIDTVLGLVQSKEFKENISGRNVED